MLKATAIRSAILAQSATHQAGWDACNARHWQPHLVNTGDGWND